jgi:hypothetical protein
MMMPTMMLRDFAARHRVIVNVCAFIVVASRLDPG